MPHVGEEVRRAHTAPRPTPASHRSTPGGTPSTECGLPVLRQHLPQSLCGGGAPPTPPGRRAGQEEVEATMTRCRVGTPEEIAGPIVFLCLEPVWEVPSVNGGSVLCG
jgi:hypothetical protein